MPLPSSTPLLSPKFALLVRLARPCNPGWSSDHFHPGHGSAQKTNILTRLSRLTSFPLPEHTCKVYSTHASSVPPLRRNVPCLRIRKREVNTKHRSGVFLPRRYTNMFMIPLFCGKRGRRKHKQKRVLFLPLVDVSLYHLVQNRGSNRYRFPTTPR